MNDPTDRDRIVQHAPWSLRQRCHLALAAACAPPPARLEAAPRIEAAGETSDATDAFLAAAEDR